MEPVRLVIMGAAGRDFHNFNVRFRDNPAFRVVAFTAAQIPDIDGRIYPPDLAGDLYPQGIPIRDEGELEKIIQRERVEEVIFAYSDIPHVELMHKASRVVARGADFTLLGAASTMLPARVPVISICAVRTGCGKSQTTRRVASILKDKGRKVVAVRHPMPYGNLSKQRVQRFGTLEDLDVHECTIEEREEYEPHIKQGRVVYAGVDYQAILEQAQGEAEIILWDGGNNDLPFYRPDLEIVVVDPHRPGHELLYHPGEANLLRAGVVVINKIDSADPRGVAELRENIHAANPRALVVDAASPLTVEDGEMIRGRRVLVIEDGPTLTHGEMKYGAGVVAATKHGAALLVDPRPYAVGSIRRTFEIYPNTGTVLPAMGYGREQMADLEQTIDRAECDLVIIATPIDLRRLIPIRKPAIRVTYELQEIGRPNLEDVLERF